MKLVLLYKITYTDVPHPGGVRGGRLIILTRGAT